MDQYWLGYDGLSVAFADVAAVLHYRPAYDRMLRVSYGSVPRSMRSIVRTAAGIYLPSRWEVEQVRARLASWRSQQCVSPI